MEKTYYFLGSGDITDLINKHSGFWLIGNGVTGMPFNGYWWFATVINANATECLIDATPIVDGGSASRYLRTNHGKVWGNWTRIATTDTPAVYPIPFVEGISPFENYVNSIIKTQDNMVTLDIGCQQQEGYNIFFYSSIAVLPFGFRPTKSMNVSAVMINSADHSAAWPGYAYIGSDGNIFVGANFGSNGETPPSFGIVTLHSTFLAA